MGVAAQLAVVAAGSGGIGFISGLFGGLSWAGEKVGARGWRQVHEQGRQSGRPGEGTRS